MRATLTMGTVKPMGPEHVDQVVHIHGSVLTDSIYTWIGREFLEYYYENLRKNEDFICHVHLFDQKVTGFLASTSAADRLFHRQLVRDSWRLGRVLFRLLVHEPGKLLTLLSASRFLFFQRPRLSVKAEGELLSFAVLPEYRRAAPGNEGTLQPTMFYRQWGISVAQDLFFASMGALAERGVRGVKIMTPSASALSNRFYTKVGCSLLSTRERVFGCATNLYHCDPADVLRRRDEGSLRVES